MISLREQRSTSKNYIRSLFLYRSKIPTCRVFVIRSLVGLCIPEGLVTSREEYLLFFIGTLLENGDPG